jgi:hypothetical protein
VAKPLAGAVGRAVRPRMVRNLLSGTDLGHPLHPISHSGGRVDAFKPISVAVFAGAAAWAAGREYVPWRPPDQARNASA